MQAHIRQQLAERDRFVAAVSHDLRTPLTRLRLRTESLDDARAQQLFRRDIAEMDAMIASTLDYLRGAAGAEAWVLLDVQALAESMADDQVAMGHRITVAGQAAPCVCRPWRCGAVWTTWWAMPCATAAAPRSRCTMRPTR